MKGTDNWLNTHFTREDGRSIWALGIPGHGLEVFENDHFRWLQFGNPIVQSAVCRGYPYQLVLPYTRRMMGALLFQPEPRRVWSLGLGGGALVRFIQQVLPETRVDGVELHSEIIRLAQRFFYLPKENERFHIHHMDARLMVQDSENGVADLIFVDVFHGKQLPDWMEQSEFFEHCRERLSLDGVLCINLLVRDGEHFATILRAIRRAFPAGSLCASLENYTNIVVYAFRQPPPTLSLKGLRQRAHELMRDYPLNFPAFVKNLKRNNLSQDGQLLLRTN